MLCFTLYMMLLGERPYDTYINLMTLLVVATTTIIKFTQEITQENRTWLAISLAILLLNFGVALMLDNMAGIQLNHWKAYILEAFFIFTSIASPYSLLPAVAPKHFNWQGYVIICTILAIVEGHNILKVILIWSHKKCVVAMKCMVEKFSTLILKRQLST